ncbi:MAG TPA: zinc ribbon domain-containing protein [Candidatus Acidoferrum sp.]|jgi:hypothetical protein
MSDTQNTSSFSEKMRRIRFRRAREKTRFRDELKIIPKWLVWTLGVIFIVAQMAFLIANLGAHALGDHSGQLWPYPNDPALSALSVAGIVTAAIFFVSCFLLLVGYVNRDARRRGMNSALWTILVVVLSSGWFALGFIIYFLVREPLPYNCPQCGATVGARFNYCPNCKCNLRPMCPQCKREVGELDKFCAYCACDLATGTPTVAGATPEGTPGIQRSV